MRLAKLCAREYVLSFIAICLAQDVQNTTNGFTEVTVYVLEHDFAMLTLAYEEPVMMGSIQTVWSFFTYGPGMLPDVIAIIYYEADPFKCKFTESRPFECFCNTTHVSLRVNEVNREKHGKKYTSYTSGLRPPNYVQFSYTIYVTVPIEKVAITNVSKSTLVVEANSSLTLECKTSPPSRPKANITWENNNVQINSTKINETVKQDLVEVKSTLSFFADKIMNGDNITCLGNNYLDDFKYDWVILNVTYPPEGSPLIDGLNQKPTFPVIENKDGFLNCTITDSNPPAKLEWRCNDDVDFVNVSIVNITSKRLQVRASRKNIPLCSCISTYKEHITKKTDVTIDVLYAATIINISANSINISEQHLDVIENETLRVTCAAEGNPSPDIAWSPRDKQNNKSPELTLANLQRNNTTTTYNCTATNLMNDSRLSVPTNDTKGFTVNVLYPPSILDLHNITKIEGSLTFVVCETLPGNPSTPIEIRWNYESQNKSVLLFNKINRTDSMWHTCEVNNTMVPTFGGKKYGIDTRRFYLKVLYPPEEISINSTTAPNHNVTDTISVIVNTSIKLICSAKGEPMPSSYWWSGLNASAESEIYVYVSTAVKDTVTCFAKNVMREMPENKTYDGINNKTIFVDALYPPKVNLTDINVNEGGDVNIGCVQTPGKTTHQSISWTSHHTNVTNNNNLIIRNVTRKQAGNCTCLVNYTMIPTYGESKSDIITGYVYLDVFYKAEISNFFMNHNNQDITVTVNESVSVHMVCILDSNPSSTMQISVGNKTISSRNLTKTLEHSISKSSCIDTGTYRCYGYNFLNANRYSSWREIKLFVNCSPRRSSSFHVQQNVTVSLNDLAIFKFIALAYPLPVFKWWRITNSIPIEANNGDAKTHNTSENELQIEFIITSVSASDIGEYVLTINNSLGNHQASFFLFQKDPTSAEQNQNDDTGLAGPVAGGVIGSIIGIGAIIGAVFLVRRRGILLKAGSTNDHHVYQNVGFAAGKSIPIDSPKIEEKTDLPTKQENPVDQVYDKEEHPYLNTMELIDLLKKINLPDLFSYVVNKSGEEFMEEYQRFPQGLVASIPCIAATKPQNAPLNRYQGIYPYDHSRVIISGQQDFFINASYIDGHSGEKQYIASLGPTVKHTLGFKAFWNMVWHERSDVIVMLTNLQEPSGMKCEKYWADKGTTRIIGDFTIQSTGEDVAADYTVRTFSVFKKEESRLVTQLHFTAWPDKKVPEDVTSLIEFRQRVKAAPSRSLGPLVVHCSAGVGRTGTYIALDRLMEEGKSSNAVNVYDCVMNMRKQRVNMVQTLDQYVYLHQALVYCLVFDIEPVTADGIEEFVKKTTNNVYSKLFQQLQQTVEEETITEIEARGRNGDMVDKNRKRADIPSDSHRIRLFLDKDMGNSDYVNAVYLNSFKRLGHFIIAQSPLPTTLDDFVCMLYQENCCYILSLDDYLQQGTNNAPYLPTDNQSVQYGNFTISCIQLDVKSAYTFRKLKIGHMGQFKKGEKVAYHFEFTGWKYDERIPNNPKLFVDFVKEVGEHTTQLDDDNGKSAHVLVHCLTGSERSGLFCAVSNLIEKMGQERQVSVVNILRRVRARRQTAIPNMEQLKFCYQAVNAFVKSYRI